MSPLILGLPTLVASQGHLPPPRRRPCIGADRYGVIRCAYSTGFQIVCLARFSDNDCLLAVRQTSTGQLSRTLSATPRFPSTLAACEMFARRPRGTIFRGLDCIGSLGAEV